MKIRTSALSLLLPLLLLLPLASSQSNGCIPQDNCPPPDCRCWEDRSIPGGIDQAATPQVILVTFQNAINGANIELYRSLFKDINNPNGCPAVGTFFVQETSTDMTLVNTLALEGHEIGVTSIDGTTPQTEEEWINNVAQVRDDVISAGVPASRVLGVRAPLLQPGGRGEFDAISEADMLYDSSCTTSTFINGSQLLWPFTYDYVPGPECVGEEDALEEVFPGKWEVIITDMEYEGIKCATPAACTNVVTQEDAFNMFYLSFTRHYESARSPFVIVVNPEWAVDTAKREGTVDFLRYARDAFPDTWILTVKQSLDWIRNPVDNDKAESDYPAWACL